MRDASGRFALHEISFIGRNLRMARFGVTLLSQNQAGSNRRTGGIHGITAQSCEGFSVDAEMPQGFPEEFRAVQMPVRRAAQSPTCSARSHALPPSPYGDG